MTKDEIKEELDLLKRCGWRLRATFVKTDTPFMVKLVELAKKYDNLISECKKNVLAEIYDQIYRHGNTQEACAIELHYSKRHVERLHKELVEYFITKLQGEQPT